MAGKDHLFSSEKQPSKRKTRGPSPRTQIINALRRASKTENEFWDMVVTRALDPDDNLVIKEIISRLAPPNKATLPTIEFNFTAKATPIVQAGEILKAASDGIMAPDVAQVFISSIASMMKIDEVTEIANRLTDIEKALGVNNG